MEVRMEKLNHVAVVVTAAVVLGAAFCLSGCKAKNNTVSAANSADKPEIIIGYAKGSLCLAPLHIAYADGYFEREFKAAGIPYKMEEVDMNQSAELLAAGKINACVGLTASLIQPIDNGLDIAFTTGLHTGCTKYFSKADSSIYKPEDLRGKKIGVPGLANSATMNIKRKLHDLGFKVNGPDADIQLIPYAQTDLPLALENGAVDAIALHDPIAYKAKEQYRFRTIMDTAVDSKFTGEYCCEAYVTTKLAKENPEAAAAYTRAIQKAAAFIEAEPEQAAADQFNGGFCSGDLATNAKLLASYNYSPSVSGGKKTFDAASKELQSFGDLKADTNAVQFVADHFALLPGVPDSVTYDKATKQFTNSESDAK